MSDEPQTGYRPAKWLPYFVALVLLAFLGTRGLNEPDEGRYAELGREMAAGGSWLVPHLNGFEHFQKPPFIYWLTALGIKLCGSNEWGARLPSALMAAGVALFTYVISRTLFNRAVAVTAALVLVSGLEFFALARTLTPDMALTFWTTAAVACFVLATCGESSRRWSWLFFVALGGGFFTKGPMGFVVPVAAVLGWQLAARGTPRRVWLPWRPGLVLALVIGVAWFVVLTIRYPALREYFLGDELLKRFASKTHGRSKPFWFFLPVLLGGWLPWTCFLPSLVLAAWQRWRSSVPLAPWQGLLLGWTLVPFVILSLSGSKLLTYILPLFPALALALAAWGHAQPERRFARPALWMAVSCLCLSPLVLELFHGLRTDLTLTAWLPPLLLLLCGALVVALRRASPAGALNRLALAVSLLWVALAAEADAFNPLLGRQASVRELARTAREFAGPDGAVFAFEARVCGFGFYLQRLIAISRGDADIVLPPSPEQSVRLVTTAADCARLAPPGKPVCGVILRDRYGPVFATNEWRELGHAGQLVLIGRGP